MLLGLPSVLGLPLVALPPPLELAEPDGEPTPPGVLPAVVVSGESDEESPQPTTLLPTSKASPTNMPNESCDLTTARFIDTSAQGCIADEAPAYTATRASPAILDAQLIRAGSIVTACHGRPRHPRHRRRFCRPAGDRQLLLTSYADPADPAAPRPRHAHQQRAAALLRRHPRRSARRHDRDSSPRNPCHPRRSCWRRRPRHHRRPDHRDRACAACSSPCAPNTPVLHHGDPGNP